MEERDIFKTDNNRTRSLCQHQITTIRLPSRDKQNKSDWYAAAMLPPPLLSAIELLVVLVVKQTKKKGTFPGDWRASKTNRFPCYIDHNNFMSAKWSLNRTHPTLLQELLKHTTKPAAEFLLIDFDWSGSHLKPKKNKQAQLDVDCIKHQLKIILTYHRLTVCSYQHFQISSTWPPLWNARVFISFGWNGNSFRSLSERRDRKTYFLVQVVINLTRTDLLVLKTDENLN